MMIIAVALLLAFGAGVLFARAIKPATANDEPPVRPQVLNVPAMAAADLGPAAPGPIPRHLKIFAAFKSGTVQVQTGDSPKHFHTATNEIQYVVEGSGTMWLDAKEIPIAPGDLIIIPKGTVHGGTRTHEGTFKLIAIKLPPQAKEDYNAVP